MTSRTATSNNRSKYKERKNSHLMTRKTLKKSSGHKSKKKLQFCNAFW